MKKFKPNIGCHVLRIRPKVGFGCEIFCSLQCKPCAVWFCDHLYNAVTKFALRIFYIHNVGNFFICVQSIWCHSTATFQKIHPSIPFDNVFTLYFGAAFSSILEGSIHYSCLGYSFPYPIDCGLSSKLAINHECSHSLCPT